MSVMLSIEVELLSLLGFVNITMSLFMIFWSYVEYSCLVNKFILHYHVAQNFQLLITQSQVPCVDGDYIVAKKD